MTVATRRREDGGFAVRHRRAGACDGANGRERGSMAVVLMAVVVLAAVLALGAARLGGALVARARADAAADAAALAAADMLALGRGERAAGAAAAETAADNDARLVRCQCAGRVATVDVEVSVAGLGRLGGPARGTARAEVRPECALGCADP
jgi:secretion/DNA translocation related TadE-like protein